MAWQVTRGSSEPEPRAATALGGSGRSQRLCEIGLRLCKDAAALFLLQLSKECVFSNRMQRDFPHVRLFILGVAIWVSCLGVYQFADDPSQALEATDRTPLDAVRAWC